MRINKISLTVIAGALLWIAIFATLLSTIDRYTFADFEYEQEQFVALQQFHEAHAEELQNLPELSRREWRRRVNQAIGYSFYLQRRIDLPDNILGLTFGAFTFTVFVDSDLPGVQYAHVLLHELVHLVHWTMNESQTEFLTFRTAFRSEDPHMRLVASAVMAKSLRISQMQNASATTRLYQATGRIINYLQL